MLDWKGLKMIERSNDADLETVLGWLALEAAQGKSTFHPNRNMIAKGHSEGELLVLRDQDLVVAFALGSPGVIDILETRPGYRGRGFGRRLAQHCIDRAAAADMAVIEGECAPATSLAFWQAMGFEQIPARYGYNPWVLLRIGKRHRLPEGVPADVVLRTFDEEALYHDNMSPLAEYRPVAVHANLGIIQLAERVVLYEPALPNGNDLVVEIALNGKRLVREKAKRAKLNAIGVRQDKFRRYYLDHIDPRGDAED